MDPTAQVALIGVLGTLLTAGAGVTVALVQTRRPGVEATLRERLVAKDERIAELKEQLADCRAARRAAEVEPT